MIADNIKGGLLTLFLGAFGDIISRTMWYNCSVDKLWTILFFIPPLSIGSSIFYFMDKIAKSPLECSEASDWFLLIIPIVVFITGFLSSKFLKNPVLSFLVPIIVYFALYAIVRMIRTTDKCTKHFKDKSKGFNISIVKRALMLSLTTNGMIMFFNFAAPFLGMIPYLGVPFRGWHLLEKIPGLQHALVLTLAHYIENLRENLPDTIKDSCMDEYEVRIKDILPSFN